MIRKTLFIAILIVVAIIFPVFGISTNDVEINMSAVNETSNYNTDIDVGYRLKHHSFYEVDVSSNYSNSTQSKVYGYSLSGDMYPAGEWSPFVFTHYSNKEALTYSYSYQRVGAGLSWVPKLLSNKHEFPYKHKFSIADIYETGKGNYVSYRYKFYFKSDKNLSISFIYFLLNNEAQNTTAVMKYAITDMINVSYRSYCETFDKNGVTIHYHRNQLRLGFEYQWDNSKSMEGG